MTGESNTPIMPKAEAVALRADYRAEQRAMRRAYRQCFWTWPWGHVWRGDGRISRAWFYKCASCGKTKVDVL